MNEITTYNVPSVSISANRKNYNVDIGDTKITLKRDDDFGIIRRKDGSAINKKPTLYKSGASKILTAFGLRYINDIVDSHKDYDKGFFYYEVKTTAYFGDLPVRTGVGCACTPESANGAKSNPFDLANSMLKKASKRSEVDLAIKLADASGWFTQDIEDETNNERFEKAIKDEDVIDTPRLKRLFAVSNSVGVSADEVKAIIKEFGYESSKEIKIRDYDLIVEKIKQKGE